MTTTRTHRIARYLLVILPLWCISCSAPKSNAWLAPHFTKPLTIAVLPLNNHSNDLRAEKLYREMMMNGLLDLGFTVAHNEDVVLMLRSKGLTDGGQLTGIPKSKLCKWLGVQAVFIGQIEKAQEFTTGVYNTKEFIVSQELWTTTEKLWTNRAETKSKTFAVSTQMAADAVIDRAAGRALRKIRGHPLQLVIEEAVYIVQLELPGKRVELSGWESRPVSTGEEIE